jgi:hypothetical protein
LGTRKKKLYGYKAVRIEYSDKIAILKMQIIGPWVGNSPGSVFYGPGHVGNKSRCGRVKVISAIRRRLRKSPHIDLHIKGTYCSAGKIKEKLVFRSDRDPSFKYIVGQHRNVKEFDPSLKDACGIGIHFFWRIEDALNYL